MDTIRQRLVSAVTARMQAVSVAEGYQTDFASVEEWQTHYDEEELREGPRLSVCDLPNEASTQSQHDERQTNRLRMQVRIFCASATRTADLRRMIGDVMQAIRADQRWGGLALYSEPGTDGFIMPQESGEVAGAAVEFTIVFSSQRFDAFE